MMDSNGGERGGGRGRKRGARGASAGGRPRSRGRGRSARSLDFTESLLEQMKKVRMAKVADKKNSNSLSAEQKLTLAALREKKQLTRFLLPDAPLPKKQKRKASPIRVPCPLLPGVPVDPPPRKIQAWERQRLPEPNHEPPPSMEVVNVPQFSPSTGILRRENLEPEQQIVEGTIELVGFSPTSGGSLRRVVERSTPSPTAEWFDPSILEASGGSLRRVVERSTPSPTAEWLDPSILEASGSSLRRVERSTPSPTAEWLDPSILEDDVILGLPTETNPGSDLEEPDQVCDAGTARQRDFTRRPEEIPASLARLLDENAVIDDLALREAASSNPDMLHFDWSNDPGKFVGQQEVFSGDSGPTFSVDGLTPLDVFQKIWDAEIIEDIVRETNRYGRHLYASLNKVWVDILPNDIWNFLALIMMQSILLLPVEREYWYPCMENLKVGNFHDIMPYKKFLRIKKSMHFVNNNNLGTTTNETKKLQKVWPIIEHLNQKFSSLYLPEQYIAIDESLLLWKGRLSFVQLIATKAARVGIKSYELCESRTGYLWKMLIYTGKGDKSNFESPVNQDEPEGATSKIVHNLVRPLLNKGHTLVMDNFYNSPLLSRTLKLKKTDTMGTLRLKGEFVPDTLKNITKFNTRQGEVVYSQTEDLTVSVWHDANIVAMISTYHNAAVGGKEKYGTFRYKPQVVLDYNMSMGGVDKKDQMLQAFPVERVRNLVWYKKLFRRLLNVSIYNAFVIYNNDKNGSQRQFRVDLVKEILAKVQLPKPRKDLVKRTSHFPTKAETNRSRCKMCSIKKKQTRTAYKCDTCNVSLCIFECFKDYHLME